MIRLGRGMWKGHILRPSSNLCRPTSSLVRGAFLDIAGKDLVSSALVWDLCSGTGAAGLEALSWGATHCVFVDRNPACTALVRRFLREHGARDRGTVITGNVRKYITTANGRPDLIFIDPPYGMEKLYRWIDGLDWRSILGRNGAVFVESGTEPAKAPGWQVRKYGDSYLKYTFMDGSA